MNAAELFIKCLENEGVEWIFGVPGEENLDVMDALLGSSIKFITVRHEQGAAFMADVYGRLTGRAGVCLATLGPGATNLVTGVADGNMDMAPMIAIAGQAGTDRLHKESHQVLDLVSMFRPISKTSTQILIPEIIPEVVRKAFKVAQQEKPGCSFIDFPENIAEEQIDGAQPLTVQGASAPIPPEDKMKQAAELISKAKSPIIMAGNGVIRAGAHEQLCAFVDKLRIPITNTFMAKGVIPLSHELSLGTVGLQARDHVACGFEAADVIICVGFDMVEYHPFLWHKDKNKKIIHISEEAAEVDEHYILACGVVGDVGAALDGICAKVNKVNNHDISSLRQVILDDMSEHAEDTSFPVKPQKIVWDLRQALAPKDIAISDVGAHKMWMARMYQAQEPNTCIISNGFASMGIALPGAIAAKLAYPDRAAVAVVGDAGFLMNVQELETAVRIGTPIVVLVWVDGCYGLIKWKQDAKFGRESNVQFGNPDFVKLAESFGAKGYHINATEELLPTLEKAVKDDAVSVIACPVDYSENMKLTEKLGKMVCHT